MNKKAAVVTVIVIGMLGILINHYDVRDNNKKQPMVFTQSGSIEILTLDQKINNAEIIIIGKATKILPSKWLAPGGKDLENATEKEIFEAGGLFTDTEISVDRVLKGGVNNPLLRVRSFVGETDLVLWVDAMQVMYNKEHSYILFLREDQGPTRFVDPGYYKSVNAMWGVYEIVGNKAITDNEEWLLEDLIAYIEKSLSGESSKFTETALPPTETTISTETPTSTP